MFGDHSLCEFDRSERCRRAAIGADAEPRRRSGWTAAASISRGDAAGRLTLRNIVPGPFLAPRIRGGRRAGAVLGHAATRSTTTPTLLGLPDDTRMARRAQPVSRRASCTVRIVPVSTRRDDRAASLDTLVAAMAQQFTRAAGQLPGLSSAASTTWSRPARGCASAIPRFAVWAQAAPDGRSRRARTSCSRFDAAGQGIGFAVLGGVFGEGVDLPGSAADRRLRRHAGPAAVRSGQRGDPRAHGGSVSARATTTPMSIPGLQKVVQAAGRVIRTETRHRLRGAARRALPASRVTGPCCRPGGRSRASPG